jgi:NADPH:quinone reductase
MRAAILKDFDTEVAVEEVPDPEPAENELLIRVRGSSVNGIDAYEATGALRGTMDYDFPVTIGTDLAGVVERVGSGVTRYRPGDEVFGFRPSAGQREGCWTELTLLHEDHEFLAAKPGRLDFDQAGAASLAAVTALAALDPLELSEGDAVLVIGGSGGVGSFAVQLAAGRGAEVIVPGLAEDEDYLRDLGATKVIDRGGDVVAGTREGHADGVDALVDMVTRAPEDFDSLAAALKRRGWGPSRSCSILARSGFRFSAPTRSPGRTRRSPTSSAPTSRASSRSRSSRAASVAPPRPQKLSIVPDGGR